MNFSIRYILKLLGLLLVLNANSQQFEKHVEWSYDHCWVGEDLVVHFNTDIDKGWHMYSTDLPEGAIAFPTTFHLKSTDDYKLNGDIQESEPILEKDPALDMKVKFFKDEAEFKQVISPKNSPPFKVKGSVEYMVCDEKKCLPPTEEEFSIKISEKTNINKSNNTSKEQGDKKENEPKKNTKKEEKTKEKRGNNITSIPKDSGKTSNGNNEKTNGSESASFSSNESEIDSKSLWEIFILGLLGGFAALLMPCLYPMIPLTVSFFTKQSKTKAEG
ncbi:MAG: protein-disulfide reductase DsbD domain-containing protein, partial [Flavobacteriales bacterium]